MLDSLPPGSPVVRAACLYYRLGWWPVVLREPVFDGSHQDGKVPTQKGWQTLRMDEAEIVRAFRENSNCGLILGEASGHLTDVDLDTPQAVASAYALLPATPMRHGRKSGGVGHYWYRCPELTAIHTFADPEDGQHLVQIRYNDKKGLQTMVPPSVHGETRDLLVWLARTGAAILDVAGALDVLKPAAVTRSALLSSAQHVALCAMAARAMPAAGLHEWGLALCGYLARHTNPEFGHKLVRCIIQAGGKEVRCDEYRKMLDDAYQRLASDGGPVKGWQSLVEAVGEKRARKISEWLGAMDALPQQIRGQGAERAGFRICSKCQARRPADEEKCPSCGAARSKLIKPPSGKQKIGVNPYRYELSLLLNLTDEGNAERFLKLNTGKVLSCELLGGWYIWVEGEGRWRLDTTRRARDLARECARQMSGEALAIAEDVNAKAAGTEKTQKVPAADARGLCCHWASQTLGGQRMEALLSLAAADRRVAVEPEELDSDPLLLNVQSHLLSLSAEGLALPPLPHDPGKRITKLAPVVYDPAATCERWMMFLSEIFGADEALIAFMRRLAGYCLFGGNPEQVIAFLWGTGANGKSTFLETISELLGDYAATTTSETVLAREGGSNNQVFALARLKGARLVTMSETEEGQRLAESLVKVMTGGEKIAARFSHGNFFEFVPEFIPVVVTNHMPELRNVDEAMRRRVLLIPFRMTIAVEDRDPFLKRTLREELSGILNWALDGLREYYERVSDGAPGLAPPPSVQSATAEYFSEQDPLGPFAEGVCLFEPQARCTKTEIYKAYMRHCEETGAYCLSQTRFGRRMKDLLSLKYNVPRDQTEFRSGLSRWWLGVALNAGGFIPQPGSEPLL